MVFCSMKTPTSDTVIAGANAGQRARKTTTMHSIRRIRRVEVETKQAIASSEKANAQCIEIKQQWSTPYMQQQCEQQAKLKTPSARRFNREISLEHIQIRLLKSHAWPFKSSAYLGTRASFPNNESSLDQLRSFSANFRCFLDAMCYHKLLGPMPSLRLLARVYIPHQSP